MAEDKDSINGIQQLSQEATIINQSFSQQARAAGHRSRSQADLLTSLEASMSHSTRSYGPLVLAATTFPHTCNRSVIAVPQCHGGPCMSLQYGPHAQVLSLDEKPFQAPEPSPFRGDNGGELAPVAHKYRRVALGGEQTLIVRCEVRRSRHFCMHCAGCAASTVPPDRIQPPVMKLSWY